MKGDIAKISELKEAAKYYGDDGDGTCVFVPGLNRVSEEEYSEQKQRMSEGLIPNMNDLGAVHAAQQTVKSGDLKTNEWRNRIQGRSKNWWSTRYR